MKNKGDTFFTQNRCDRCFKELRSGRTMSWFNDETICMECSEKERELKRDLRSAGKNPDEFEGCGYIPTPAIRR